MLVVVPDMLLHILNIGLILVTALPTPDHIPDIVAGDTAALLAQSVEKEDTDALLLVSINDVVEAEDAAAEAHPSEDVAEAHPHFMIGITIEEGLIIEEAADHLHLQFLRRTEIEEQSL